MTDRTRENLVAEQLDEIAAELGEAVVVCTDQCDVDALEALDFDAVLAGRTDRLYGITVGREARSVVLCAGTDPHLFGWLRVQFPHLAIYYLPGCESPALALGLGLPTAIDPATWQRKRQTWAAILQDARRCDLHELLRALQTQIEAQPRRVRTRFRNV